MLATNDLEIQGFLHVCGGDPAVTGSAMANTEFSPRMWR